MGLLRVILVVFHLAAPSTVLQARAAVPAQQLAQQMRDLIQEVGPFAVVQQFEEFIAAIRQGRMFRMADPPRIYSILGFRGPPFSEQCRQPFRPVSNNPVLWVVAKGGRRIVFVGTQHNLRNSWGRERGADHDGSCVFFGQWGAVFFLVMRTRIRKMRWTRRRLGLFFGHADSD